MVTVLTFFAFPGVAAALELSVCGHFTPASDFLHRDALFTVGGHFSSAVTRLARPHPSSHGWNDCALGESCKHICKTHIEKE